MILTTQITPIDSFLWRLSITATSCEELNQIAIKYLPPECLDKEAYKLKRIQAILDEN